LLRSGLNRLGGENNHVQAGNDRFEAEISISTTDQDCLSVGLDRYGGKQDRYDDGKDRYNRAAL